MRRFSLLRLALALVPRDWRDAVARDLEEDASVSGWRAAPHAAAIGIRLHASRGRDWLTHPSLGRITIMREFTRDLKFAVRSAVRRPGYALAIIATLAIGIGATTAIYSVFNWVLFRPLPGVVRADELVTVRYQSPKSAASFWVSYRDFADLRDGVPGFAAFAASLPLKVDVTNGGDPRHVDAEAVSASYFTLFGVRPVLGRDFMPTEEQPGAHAPAAILSRRLWRGMFNEDPAVLGKTFMLDGRTFTIVGVVPVAFQGRSLATTTDVWMPLGAYAIRSETSRSLLTSRRETIFGDSFGRLRPGVTLTQVQQQAAAVAAAVPDFVNRSPGKAVRSSIGPVLTAGVGGEVYTHDRLVTIFRLLMGAVSLVLLLACANAANLLLARAAGRRREIAVCQAIGASRFRIIRQHLAEGLILSLAAGVAALALAVWLTALFDGMRIITSLPALDGVSIDWRVGAFALAASLLTCVLFAAIPAVTSSRVDLQSSLKDGLTASRSRRPVLRGTLVAIQVTLSVLLVVGAGLFIRSLHNIRGIDLGLQADGLVTISVTPARFGYTPDKAQAYVRSLLQRLRDSPGIGGAAFTWTTPFSPNRSETGFLPQSSAGSRVIAASTTVSTGFFSTMRIPILEGRDFTDSEIRNDDALAGPIVISRRLAAELFPGSRALGAKVPLDYPKGKIVEVVGIVGDVRGRPLTDEPEPWAYLPATKPTWGTIQVRTAAGGADTVKMLRAITRDVDPVVIPNEVEPFGASIERLLAEQRLLARLSAIFAAVAAVLAAIGIYGMMSGAVMERRREFGIRLALGAGGRTVVTLVMRTAVLLAGCGVIAGLIGAAVLRRFVESRLFGITGLDPATLAFGAASVIVLSLVASLLPAIRAARIDPVRSLRVE